MPERSNPEIPFREPSNEFKILTEHDRALLEEAGVPLLQKFLNDFPAQLPDAIIFPDTGARPLPYLLDPVFQKVAEQRGIALPQSYYFKVISSSLVKEVAHWEKRYGVDIKAVPGKIMRLADTAIHPPAGSSRLNSEQQFAWVQWYQSQAKDAEHAGLAIAPDEKMWQARAEEVKKDLKRHGIDSPNFALFDDNASSDGGNIMGVRKGFGDKIPAYVLLGEEDSSEENRISVGKVVSNVRGSMDGSATSFNYRQSKLLGVTKKAGDPRNPYANKSSNRDLTLMRDLRTDMYKLGEDLVSKLNL